MKGLREAAQAYVALRRGLGFKLKIHQRLLEEFASFLEKEGEPVSDHPKAQFFGLWPGRGYRRYRVA